MFLFYDNIQNQLNKMQLLIIIAFLIQYRSSLIFNSHLLVI